ncbi:hypothetical protein [Martelella mangrovi]|uniref:DUF4350 domain-containing protein n=1 Tax=Martelella mangrovi TaxID=1397477 RepID=A0ABV2IFT0_9HYPH
MSEKTPVKAQESSSFPLVILAAVVVAAMVLIFFSGSSRIDRSAIGTDGLALWLKREGIAVEPSAPEEVRGEKTPILRLLPLYDTDLTVGRGETKELEAGSPAATLRNLSLETFRAKIGNADTLVVLPKWRSDMVTSGTATPEVLIPTGQLTIFGLWRGPSVRSAGEDFVVSPIIDSRTGEAMDGEAALYAPRVLSDVFDEACAPLLTLGDKGTLLARCEDLWGEGDSFYMLSDPDLLDNHGLANGDNARLAPAVIGKLAEGRPVYIDNTTYANITDTSGLDPRERSLADLERFFEYPFSLLWISIVVTAGLALWRGSRRFGSPVGEADTADMASKTRTIAASARLLRLSGDQDDLVFAYVDARMDTLDAAVLGPSRRPMTAPETMAQIMTRVRRRVPETGERLAQTYDAVVKTGLDSHQRLAALIPFEKAVQETLDAFGHASRPS